MKKVLLISTILFGGLLCSTSIANTGQAETIYDQEDSAPLYIRHDVTIQSNLGPQIVKDQEGQVKQVITVKVPSKKGYTADRKTVKAIVTQNGIICAELVTYTKNPGTTLSTGDINEDDNRGYISTMDKVTDLYQFNGSKRSDGNRGLKPMTDWRYDHVKIHQGETYYRVSTNEWAKSDQVYRYENETGVLTPRNATNEMIQSNTKKIENRVLAGGTDWAFDRIAYLGMNEGRYYRVSTNEFIKEYDVTIHE